MFKRIGSMVFCLSLTLLVACSGTEGAQPSKKKAKPRPAPLRRNVLANIRKEHPRLLFTNADQRRIEKLAKSDKFLAELITQLKNNAERMLTERVLEYKSDPSYKKRLMLLGKSRTCLARVSVLAMAYRLTGDKRFFERGRKEMLAVAAFKTWNPDHFLDLSEMCAGMAIGYDWFYDALSKADRTTIRNAIIAKALKPGMKAYDHPKKGKGWWTRCHHNWNMVCNAGQTLGALAIAEDEPDLAEKVVSHAIRSVQNGMTPYKPDGSWHEGPGYWTYGTSFAAVMFSALDSALGSDFGLAKSEGFASTMYFPIYMIWPSISTGIRSFNHADCGTGMGINPVMYWLARKFDSPPCAWFARKVQKSEIERNKQRNKGKYKIRYYGYARLYALSIAWFDERGDASSTDKLPLDVSFSSKAGVMTMRSAWNDEHAIFVGFKGGQNNLGHGHMDVGTFVLSSDGVMWAIDLGGDSYTLPGYWDHKEGGRRWNYYRLASKSHNTLVIGSKLQHVKNSTSKVLDFSSKPDHVHAVVDMSNAYRGQAKKVLRGVTMPGRKAVLIQDEITNP
ncbi:MAG: DUF4962 domain-containing protein, partial [Phycisphaerae bacterium]|nr:DUF4962 domain-containing protein [Phycisphaerae bacterium]